jgi:hypothetical protein
MNEEMWEEPYWYRNRKDEEARDANIEHEAGNCHPPDWQHIPSYVSKQDLG